MGALWLVMQVLGSLPMVCALGDTTDVAIKVRHNRVQLP